MEDVKKKIEAVLYTTGRAMDVEEISRLCGVASAGLVKEAILHLVKDYDGRDGALIIQEEDGKYKLNIKKEYLYLTTQLLEDVELSLPIQSTLAVIAYKQPLALQSEVIQIRGNMAYDHISLLKEKGFLISEKKGRTRLLKLTDNFYDYFDIVRNELKTKIREVEDKFQEPIKKNNSEEKDEE